MFLLRRPLRCSEVWSSSPSAPRAFATRRPRTGKARQKSPARMRPPVRRQRRNTVAWKVPRFRLARVIQLKLEQSINRGGPEAVVPTAPGHADPLVAGRILRPVRSVEVNCQPLARGEILGHKGDSALV